MPGNEYFKANLNADYYQILNVSMRADEAYNLLYDIVSNINTQTNQENWYICPNLHSICPLTRLDIAITTWRYNYGILSSSIWWSELHNCEYYTPDMLNILW